MMNKYSKCKLCNAELKKINLRLNLVQCVNCELIFCENIFTQEEFVTTYDNLYNSLRSKYERHSKTEFENLKNGIVSIGINRKKIIKEALFDKKIKNVLEIGSGIGLVGVYLKNEYIGINYKGIELDKEAYLKSKEFNLDTYNGDFTIMKGFNEDFDIIMLWEVIEHLQDLNSFLKLAYLKLKPKGKIVFSTPNYEKINNYPLRERDAIYQNEPPIHLNFFTKKNLEKVFKNEGFTIVKLTVKKFPYIESNYLRLIKNYLKALFGKYYGPTIYVVAQKK